jgi:hypothetical protein
VIDERRARAERDGRAAPVRCARGQLGVLVARPVEVQEHVVLEREQVVRVGRIEPLRRPARERDDRQRHRTARVGGEVRHVVTFVGHDEVADVAGDQRHARAVVEAAADERLDLDAAAAQARDDGVGAAQLEATPARVAHPLPDHLHRHHAVQLEVQGLVDGARAAAREHAPHPVSPAEDHAVHAVNHSHPDAGRHRCRAAARRRGPIIGP